MKRFFGAALAAAMLCALLTGCDNQKQNSELKKITVSEVTHSIFYAPMYAAVNNGYFAREGIELELINAGGADKGTLSII